MRPRAGLLVALLVLAAGCGGSTPSASEQWAEDVCGPMDDWATQMQAYSDDVRAAISSPSTDSITTIQTTIEKGDEETCEGAHRARPTLPLCGGRLRANLS